jgi:hypothetical protein
MFLLDTNILSVRGTRAAPLVADWMAAAARSIVHSRGVPGRNLSGVAVLP